MRRRTSPFGIANVAGRRRGIKTASGFVNASRHVSFTWPLRQLENEPNRVWFVEDANTSFS
jgi:hypothetical protein